jgi:hypothetical protein
MPMMTTTIKSSISVKPFLLLDISLLLKQLDGANGSASATSKTRITKAGNPVQGTVSARLDAQITRWGRRG